MRAIYVLLLLVVSNTFMTFAWYGHLFIKEHFTWVKNLSFFQAIALSWAIALFEYSFLIPANKLGFLGEGGRFNLFELKAMSEAISIIVFILINIFIFKSGMLSWRIVMGFALILSGAILVLTK
jgi:uncharacterized protein (DUF486 family)